MPRASLLVESPDAITDLIGRIGRIAVLGIKTSAAAGQPAYEVPAFLQQRGYTILPVPVYYPDATEILGAPVHRAVADVPGPIDCVLVFRRSSDVAAHLPDLLAARPMAVWMQLGIRDAATAEALADAGIAVVQDHCLKLELLARNR
ncbi:MAG: CoA-binding protein [Gemmatimonadaceae bacterium]|jgi:hypothetical protein|nr:CoA-binding protein [Gemmatimonadaceae bacterium]